MSKNREVISDRTFKRDDKMMNKIVLILICLICGCVYASELPNVLLIGDSVSIGYTKYVQILLKGKANVYRVPAKYPYNCRSTSKGLRELDSWIGDKEWDVIYFNWGLHDMRDVHLKGRISIEQYGKNLEKLVIRLKKTKAKLIWATTTPVRQDGGGRFKGDAKKYNAVAAKIMQKHGITIDDLYEFVLNAGIGIPEDVHYTFKGLRLIAKEVADSILKKIRWL